MCWCDPLLWTRVSVARGRADRDVLPAWLVGKNEIADVGRPGCQQDAVAGACTIDGLLKIAAGRNLDDVGRAAGSGQQCQEEHEHRRAVHGVEITSRRFAYRSRQAEEHRPDKDHGRFVADPDPRKIETLHGNRCWSHRVFRILVARRICGSGHNSHRPRQNHTTQLPTHVRHLQPIGDHSKTADPAGPKFKRCATGDARICPRFREMRARELR